MRRPALIPLCFVAIPLPCLPDVFTTASCAGRTASRCSVDLRPNSRPRPGSLAATWQHWNRPPPVIFARQQLDQDFAVFLMRSSYDCCDELDFVAMNDFQKHFFEIRQGAWEVYLQDNPSVPQGRLSDVRLSTDANVRPLCYTTFDFHPLDSCLTL
jgi:hypothetical protein